MSRSIGQEFSIKKNSFSIVAANTTLLSRVPVTGYTFGEPNTNFFYEDFKIYNQTMILNPKFGLGYSMRLWKKVNPKHMSTKYFMITCDVEFSKIDYKRTKVGTYYGGYKQLFFEGRVQERLTSQFLSLGLGAKYYFTSFRGEIFGIAIGVNRHEIISSKYSAEYLNTPNNQTWTYTMNSSSQNSQIPLMQRIKTKLNDPCNYYSLNVALSFGKKLSKSCHAGFYLGYSAPEYLFYRSSTAYETRGSSFTRSTRYLTYFNIITYGIYFMF